jgi:hypothetical protein
VPDVDEDEPMTTKDKAAHDTKRTLARRETRHVSLLRYVFVLILLVTALGASLATYYYAAKVEQDNFQSEFDNVAEVTQRSFVEAVQRRLHALDVFSSGITSHALNPSNTDAFPNVTVPDWEVKGAQLRTQTDGVFVIWLPLVTDETRAGYEAYTQHMQGQLFQSYGKEEMARQYQDMHFNITKMEGKEEEAKEEEEKEEDHRHERQLHVGDPPSGPDYHQTIHDGIWEIDVSTSTLHACMHAYRLNWPLPARSLTYVHVHPPYGSLLAYYCRTGHGTLFTLLATFPSDSTAGYLEF